MTLGVLITDDREHPERYLCANFLICGRSSSHDPSYIGWQPLRTAHGRYACSSQCRYEADIRNCAP